jgi:DNA-binding NtrC family response regulator
LPFRFEPTAAPSITELAGEPFSAISSSTGDRPSVRVVLGKVSVVRKAIKSKGNPLSDKLQSLRDRLGQRYRVDRIPNRLPAMEQVVNQIGLACQSKVSVLIKGESGTGKRWIARTIHFQGTERTGPFIQVDCGRIPREPVATLLEGDKGVLARHGPGTLYLREPGLLPRDLQVVLCDWLKEAESGRFRLIAGISHRSLDHPSDAGIIPELLAQMGTLIAEVPPLRARLADLDGLTNSMLSRFADADSAIAKSVSSEARSILMNYNWPGNLRELREVLDSATRHSAGEIINIEDLPAYMRLLVRLEQTPAPAAEQSLPLDQILSQVEQRLIQLALRLTKGNKTKAADLLAIPRPRLWRRLEGAE